MPYNKSLDLMLAATLAMRKGKHTQAATLLAQAAEDESLPDAIDQVEDINGEDDETDANKMCNAAFAAAAKRLATAGDAELEPLGDGDLPAGAPGVDAGSDGSAVMRGEDAVTARLRRAAKNKSALAGAKK